MKKCDTVFVHIKKQKKKKRKEKKETQLSSCDNRKHTSMYEDDILLN